jgi:subtilase family serine protease
VSRPDPRTPRFGMAQGFATALLSMVMLGTGLGTMAAADPTSAPRSERVCARQPAPGHATCFAERRTDVKPLARSVIASPAAIKGYSPAELRSAYAIPTELGAGATVAVVDAFDNPNAESDLAVYRSTWGLPPCSSANGCFRQVNQRGAASPLPSTDAGWATEISLDLQMVSAACPLCRILLVEADDTSFGDLGAAVNYAAAQGVAAISNSYGADEDQDTVDYTAQYFTHPGIAVLAASGDDGYRVEFPAAAPGVIAVGGTTLNHAANARGWAESAWRNGGSGCSTLQPKPAWQHDVGCSGRTVVDVSAVADPNTGPAVYDTFSGGWTVIAGTSAATPLLAAMYALADNPDPSAAPLYRSANAAGLNDVITGQNYSCDPAYLCQANTGYDGPTGVGTPRGILALGGTP